MAENSEINTQSNINQPQSEVPKPPVKWARFVFIAVAALVVIASVYLLLTKDKKPLPAKPEPAKSESVATPEQVKQSSALLTNSQVTFGNVSKISSISEKDVPSDLKEFIPGTALALTYEKINYENGQTGFFLTYEVQNTNVRTASSELDKNIRTWIKFNGGYSNDFGYYEYNKDKNQTFARVMLFQNGKNIKVTVKSQK